MTTISHATGKTTITITGSPQGNLNTAAYDAITTELISHLWEMNTISRDWNENEDDRTDDKLTEIEYFRGRIDGIISTLETIGYHITVITDWNDTATTYCMFKKIYINKDIWEIG